MNLLLKEHKRLPFKGFKAQAYAWPGGYTITYYDLKAGDAICASCASIERFKTELTPDVHWEGPADWCACCNAELPSEYGDPDSDPETPVS